MTSRGPVDRIVIDLEDDIPASVGQESAHDPLGVPESTRGKCKRKFDVTPSEIDYEPPQKERLHSVTNGNKDYIFTDCKDDILEWTRELRVRQGTNGMSEGTEKGI